MRWVVACKNDVSKAFVYNDGEECQTLINLLVRKGYYNIRIAFNKEDKHEYLNNKLVKIVDNRKDYTLRDLEKEEDLS